jgi:hypothetical protein
VRPLEVPWPTIGLLILWVLVGVAATVVVMAA